MRRICLPLSSVVNSRPGHIMELHMLKTHTITLVLLFATAAALQGAQSAEEILDQARSQWEQKHYKQAEKLSRKAAKMAPNLAAAHALQGRSLVRLEKYKKARTALERAVTLDSTDATAFADLGYTYGQLAQPEEAVGAYGKAIALDPSWTDLYYQIAGTRYRQGRYEEARQTATRALYDRGRVSPRGLPYAKYHGPALLVRAVSSEQLGEFASALADYYRLAEDPQQADQGRAGIARVRKAANLADPELLLAVADSCIWHARSSEQPAVMTSMYGRAAEACGEVLEISPGRIDAIHRLAQTIAELKDTDPDAATSWVKTLAKGLADYNSAADAIPALARVLSGYPQRPAPHRLDRLPKDGELTTRSESAFGQRPEWSATGRFFTYERDADVILVPVAAPPTSYKACSAGDIRRFSPDDRYLACLGPVTDADLFGVRALIATEGRTPVETPRLTGRWFRWAPGGDGLLFLADGSMQEADITAGDLCYYDVKTGKTEVLVPGSRFAGQDAEYRLSGFRVSPDGQRIVLFDPYEWSSLRLLYASDARSTLLALVAVGGYASGNVVWSQEGDAVFAAEPVASMPRSMRRLGIPNGDFTMLEERLRYRHNDLAYAGDGPYLYYYSDYDPDGDGGCVLRFDLGTRKEEVLARASVVSGFDLSPTGRYLSYFSGPVREDAEPVCRLLDLQTKEEIDLPGRVARFHPRDERRLLVDGEDGIYTVSLGR